MALVMAFHEVDDLQHWLTSEKRDEFFSARGMTARTFVDPAGSNRVGVLIETPDMETLQNALETEEARAAMEHDGVRADTVLVLAES